LELMLAAVAVDVAVAMEDAAAAEEDVEVVGGVDLWWTWGQWSRARWAF
jgi:hypothetical protein